MEVYVYPHQHEGDPMFKNLIPFCLFVVVLGIDSCTLNKYRFLDFSLYGTAKCKEFSVIVVMYLQFKYAVFPQKNNP